jgi:hypothetical protein
VGGVRDDIGPCGAACQRGGERERKALAEAGRGVVLPFQTDRERSARVACMVVVVVVLTRLRGSVPRFFFSRS